MMPTRAASGSREVAVPFAAGTETAAQSAFWNTQAGHTRESAAILTGRPWGSFLLAALASQITGPENRAESYPILLGPALLIDGSANFGTITGQTVPADLLQCWVQIPDSPADASPDVGTATLIDDLRRWTTWSNRALAEVLDTTHPTIRRLADGQVTAKSAAAADRLHRLHGVVQRLWLIAGRQGDRLGEVLRADTRTAETPFVFLAHGRYVDAYRAVVRTLRGPEPDVLTASSATTSLDATHPMDDEDHWV